MVTIAPLGRAVFTGRRSDKGAAPAFVAILRGGMVPQQASYEKRDSPNHSA